MKTNPYALILSTLLVTTSCPASNVGLGTIEQPVNLGAESDPSRIPLGRVATESNYNYSRGPVISAPRPSLHGAMEWKGGSELDQNLASVFGLEVSDHDLPQSGATIHLKDWPAPAYSPYTKDQVLAATIHCLLRSSRGTPKNPIELKITSDSPDDKELIEKYSSKFINAKDDAKDPPVEPVKLPGCQLETDARGITWVVFPDKKSDAKPSDRPPVMIPFSLKGGDFDDNMRVFLPVWTGTGRTWEQSLEVIGRPYPLFYDCYEPSNSLGPETNSLYVGNTGQPLFRFDVTVSDGSVEADFLYPNMSTETFAATILAIVISAQPTAGHPLTVTLGKTGGKTDPEWRKAFKASPGWQVDESGHGLTCSFVWNPETATLTKGSVPVLKIVRSPDGELGIEAPEPKPDSGNGD